MYKFNDKNKLFITSDEHYGHYNIIRMANRPYDSVEKMDRELINNHNSIVSEDDTTIHLGDFIWKGHKFDDIVFQLNGFHIFIKGNHDHEYPSESYAKNNYFKYKILNNQIFEFEYMKKKFVACHYPIYQNEWNGGYRNSIHFYGHTHRDLELNNAFHVGVDTNEWKPINLTNF